MMISARCKEKKRRSPHGPGLWVLGTSTPTICGRWGGFAVRRQIRNGVDLQSLRRCFSRKLCISFMFYKVMAWRCFRDTFMISKNHVKISTVTVFLFVFFFFLKVLKNYWNRHLESISFWFYRHSLLFSFLWFLLLIFPFNYFRYLLFLASGKTPRKLSFF